jgi:hypothetical protein
VSDVFIESHYRGGRRLLNEHGLALCAEAGGLGAPIWASCPVESLKALGAVDILRGEFWPKHRNIWLVKEVASAAHVYGKQIVDAESFTSWRHWQDGPGRARRFADLRDLDRLVDLAINAHFGLYAAMTALRHTNIATTASYGIEVECRTVDVIILPLANVLTFFNAEWTIPGPNPPKSIRSPLEGIISES